MHKFVLPVVAKTFSKKKIYRYPSEYSYGGEPGKAEAE